MLRQEVGKASQENARFEAGIVVVEIGVGDMAETPPYVERQVVLQEVCRSDSDRLGETEMSTQPIAPQVGIEQPQSTLDIRIDVVAQVKIVSHHRQPCPQLQRAAVSRPDRGDDRGERLNPDLQCAGREKPLLPLEERITEA